MARILTEVKRKGATEKEYYMVLHFMVQVATATMNMLVGVHSTDSVAADDDDKV